MIHIIVTLLCLVFLIICIGFFSSSETAYISLSKIKMRQLVQQNVKHARLAAKLKNSMDSLLTLVLVGTNFMNTLSSALATSLALELVGNKGVGFASAIITFCVTIFGQIIPKTSSVLQPDKIALRSAPALFALQKILFPIVVIFSKLANLVANIAEKILGNEGGEISEEEIKMMIDIGTSEGTLEENEQKMLHKIFQFSDLRAHDIMKHRSFIHAISVNSSREDFITLVQKTGCSKIPVYEESLDSVVGAIDYKTALFSENSADNHFIKNNMKDVSFVPETFSALEVLAQFKKSKDGFAIVLDEQGCTAGIVTIDDIMRVVFGRIIDENSTTELSPEERIKIIAKNEYIIPGDMQLDDVNKIVSLSLESESFNTLGGWLLEKIGYLPATGEMFSDKVGTFIVEDQARRRILSVRVKKH
ncbi:MAG: HlyC/CorC family transporter [Treponema sp.]|nr:HlyC/CorC family transporter [Treponema sp.]